MVNQDGERIGTVQSVRRQEDGTFVVIDHGGVLDLPQAVLMVPAERLALDGQGRVMLMGLTQQEINAIPQMEPTAGQEISAGETVRISQVRTQQDQQQQ